MGKVVLNVNSATVGASAATEGGIGTGMAASASAAAVALTTVMPMGADLDSVAFAEAMNAAGASYLGAVGQHVAGRETFAGAQNLAAATYTATDAIHNATLAL